MDRGYQKIFWGLLLVTFHLNLGAIQLLPPFIGWLILISGIRELSHRFENSSIATDSFHRGGTIAKALVVLTLLSTIASIAIGRDISESPVFMYYPMLIITLEIIVFFHVLEGTHQIFSTLGFEERALEASKKLRTYLVFALTSAILLIFALFFNHSPTMIIGLMTAIIAVIYLLVYLNQLKNFWMEDPLGKPILDESGRM